MFESGKFDDMYNYCTKLLETNPDDMVALQNSALALLHLEKFEDSIIYCDKVLQIKIFDIYALKNKIYSLEKLKRYDDALTCCKIILDIDGSDVWALNSMGLSLNKLDRYQEAIEFYDKAQIIDPSSLHEASIAKSQAFEKLGMEDEAFLAAQGVLVKDMEKIKIDAKKNKCSVFHQYCQNEFEELKNKKPI